MEFKKIRAEDYCDSVKDGTHDSPKKVESGYKLITSKHIKENGIDYENAYYISEEDYLKVNQRSLVEKNDILYSMIGTIGLIYRVAETPKFAIKNMGLFKIKNELKSKWLYYYLKSPKMIKYIQTLLSGSTQQYITLRNLRDLPIEYPESQKDMEKIVKILDSIDKKIESNNQINDNLHNLAENLFLKLYNTGKECKLEELITNISTGSRPKGGAKEEGIPSIGAEKIERIGVYNYSSEKYIDEEYFNKLKNGIVKSGDVMLYKDGAYTGKVSMALNGFPHEKCAVNEHVFIINTEKNWAKFYLYFTLFNQENRKKVFTMASSKAAQPGLNQVELKALEIKLADKDKIIDFEKQVEPLMEKIILNSLENRTLEQLRDTLLPKLMNGEIDLDKIEI